MRRAAWLIGIAFAGAAAMWPVLPAAADEPGDLIIARTITPRIAYATCKQGSKESHSASDWGWASESSCARCGCA